MAVNPYLFFSGDCAEAFAFYASVFGVEARVLTNGDVPEGEQAPGAKPTAVMHASIPLGESVLMGSDDPTGTGGPKSGFAVAYTAAGVDEVHRVVNALAEGGQLDMPVGPTFWAPAFGGVTDRFGVAWLVDTLPAD